MNQNNTYLCDEFLGAVYFQIKHTQKYLKKKFEINIYLYIYIFFNYKLQCKYKQNRIYNKLQY